MKREWGDEALPRVEADVEMGAKGRCIYAPAEFGPGLYGEDLGETGALHGLDNDRVADAAVMEIGGRRFAEHAIGLSLSPQLDGELGRSPLAAFP